MTIYGLASAIVWAVVAFIFIQRADRLCRDFRAMQQEQERQASSPVVIPNDLVAIALQESEKHAQESTLEAMRERYAVAKDWNRVRRAFGLAEAEQETTLQ